MHLQILAPVSEVSVLNSESLQLNSCNLVKSNFYNLLQTFDSFHSAAVSVGCL